MFSISYEYLMTHFKRATDAVISIAIAEFVWRFARCLGEIFFYSKHYPYNTKWSAALSHGFTFSIRSRYLLAILALVFCQYFSVSTFYQGFVEQWHLMPIWWVFRYTEFTRSMFDYSDFIRSNCGLDYGSGMAASYFHGYINLTLPRTAMSEGIVQRMERYESMHGVQFAIKRLFILIPISLHTLPVIESRLMERQDNQPLEGVMRNRAGVSRPYSNSVYRICIDNKPYYITIEGATPLLSYCDALNYNLTRTPIMQAMQKEILIKFYCSLKKTLNECPGTQKQCELVLYNDYTPDGQQQDVGEILCMHIKRMWEKMPPEERPI